MNSRIAAAQEQSKTQRVTLDITSDELVTFARTLLAADFRLAMIAGHDDTTQLRIVYAFLAGHPDRRIELQLGVDADAPSCPSLVELSFSANRFERELHDLFGVIPTGHHNLASLVSHGRWPDGYLPMRNNAEFSPALRDPDEPYSFIDVKGEGIYEIPVGPVHAGLIEPGHFRFSVVGETILTMKMRLYYVHRGVERLFQGKNSIDGVSIAERISGDSAIAHNLAYCQAIEDACGTHVSDVALRRRAYLLELERLYNHIGDIGMLCNDVAFGFLHAHTSRIKESLLRINALTTGHRLLRGAIHPGTTSLLHLPDITALEQTLSDLHELCDIAMKNATLLDRFHGTGELSFDAAAELGVVGCVARASGIAFDARTAHGDQAIYANLRVPTQKNGDVMARFLQRVAECESSVALLGELHSPELVGIEDAKISPCEGTGLGLVEGWRGTVAHRVEVAENGTLRRVKVVDPSFFNWPALPIALDNTIVPDFPLVNKSFNLSYAGNDL